MEQEGTRQQQVDILNLGLGDNPAERKEKKGKKIQCIISAHEVKNTLLSFKMMKNGVFYFGISPIIPEIFKHLFKN